MEQPTSKEPAAARAPAPFLGVSAFLMVIAAAALNPGVRLALFLLAAAAALPALRGPGRRRWVAAAAVLLSAALAAATYPAYDRHRRDYRQRAAPQNS